MNTPFQPQLQILPAPQRRLWAEFSEIPEYFTLYGGTALALRLGHRNSVDFDFFCFRELEAERLSQNLELFRTARVLQSERNTLTVLVDRDGPVKLSFFGVPRLKSLLPPDTCLDNGLHIASLLDLAGTKAAVVQVRAEAKDYLDIDALIRAGGIDLPQALAAAAHLYGQSFNPQITLKALSWFGDGDLPNLPDHVKERLVTAARAVDLDLLPRVTPENLP
jgi:Nucleotidyl transferase AbiEii toxin, Type IV TA system